MMRRSLIFLILAFLYSTGNCQSYETIVDTTKQWSVVTECYSDENYPEILSISTNGYRFRGDTIIDSMHYSFLEVCVNDSLFENWGKTSFLFRDDSVGRVYIHDYNQEILLYDYNVEAGDTIWIPNVFNFSDSVCWEIIDSVGIEVIAGKERKVVYWWGGVLYAKGFGSYKGPFGLTYHCMVGNVGKYVSCFYQNDTLLYQKGENCYVHYNHNSINETKQVKTKIYPNPANSYIILEVNNPDFVGKPFTIYNSIGMEVKKGRINSNKNKIDMTGVQKGIYFLKINNEVHKIVKK